MGVDVGLINLGELATHVPLHEYPGLCVVIKTDEVHADVNTADTAEDVVVMVNELLQERRSVIQITSTVVESQMTCSGRHQWVFRIATNFKEWQPFLIKECEHFVIDTCSILATIKHPALLSEECRVVGLLG